MMPDYERELMKIYHQVDKIEMYQRQQNGRVKHLADEICNLRREIRSLYKLTISTLITIMLSVIGLFIKLV